MATRSMICIELEDGSNTGTYCHFDGYPSHMRPILEDATYDQVKAMVDEGNTNGGLKGIDGPKTFESFDEPGLDMSGTFEVSNEMGIEYYYLKRLNGEVSIKSVYN